MPAKLLTWAQTQEQIPVSKSSIHRLVNAGQLTRVHIGSRSFITADSINRFMDRLVEGEED